MKRIFFFLILLAVTVNLAIAEKGIYLEQKTQVQGMMGQPSRDTISKTWIGDQRMRNEDSENITIIRFDLGKVWVITRAQKQFFEMSMDELSKMAKMSKGMMEGMEELKMEFKKTGRTKKINKWNCYEVLVESPTMTRKMWLTEDLPFSKNDYIKFYEKNPEFKEFAEAFNKMADLKGYPVAGETVIKMMGMEIKSSDELVLIRKQNLSDDLFEVSKENKQVDNPMKMMFQK